MPEGVGAYPKWQGELSGPPTWIIICGQELRRAWDNAWARAAITLAAAYAVVWLGQLWTASNTSDPSRIHTTENFLRFLELLRWAALGVASVMAGSALLEDERRGALELYLSRAVTRADYLFGKLLAVFGLTFATLWIPTMVYFSVSFMLFDVRPEAWEWIPLKSLGYAALWAFVVTGLGLGLAAVTRSARAGTLLLFGGVFVVDVILSDLLSFMTKNDQFKVISPLAALTQQNSWLFGVDAAFKWPYWWGLVALGLYALLGWGLMLWRHPRLRGVDA